MGKEEWGTRGLGKRGGRRAGVGGGGRRFFWASGRCPLDFPALLPCRLMCSTSSAVRRPGYGVGARRTAVIMRLGILQTGPPERC